MPPNSQLLHSTCSAEEFPAKRFLNYIYLLRGEKTWLLSQRLSHSSPGMNNREIFEFNGASLDFVPFFRDWTAHRSFSTKQPQHENVFRSSFRRLNWRADGLRGYIVSFNASLSACADINDSWTLWAFYRNLKPEVTFQIIFYLSVTLQLPTVRDIQQAQNNFIQRTITE